MPLINILIIENDSSFASSLRIALKKWGRVEIKVFREFEAARLYLNSNRVDLFIIKTTIIEKGDGIEFGKHLTSTATPLVYIAEPDEGLIYEQAKQENLLAFLVKPFDFKTLSGAIDVYFDDSRNFFLFKKGKDTIRLKYSDIHWIKSVGNYCIIKADDKEVSIKSSLTNLKQQYLGQNFIQIHRAFIVNADKIEGINIKTNRVEVHGASLPIGRKFRKPFLDQLDVI